MTIHRKIQEFADVLDVLAAFDVWTETLIEVSKDFVFGLDLEEAAAEELLNRLTEYIYNDDQNRAVLAADDE